MNVLIISYNNNYKNINLYNYDQTLYLVRNITPSIKKCKYVDLIKEQDLTLEIINQIKKYYNKFDYILFLDNKDMYDINANKLLFFNKEITEKWKINGIINSSFWKDDNYFAESFDINCLLINCKNITELDIENMNKTKVGDVNFPPLSVILFEQYEYCYSCKSLGITKIKNRDNIILI